MKKIMFNDKYGLMEAVLNGKKTQTRRVISVPNGCEIFSDSADTYDPHTGLMQKAFKLGDEWLYVTPSYQIDEVVAVAQSYKTISMYGGEYLANMMQNETTFKTEYCGAGWNNKMFVKAELMPHHIRITNIRVEKLQDISDEDCLKEGVYLDYSDIDWDEGDEPNVCYRARLGKEFNNPQDAFSALINKVSGKGTWDSNPYVFVYDFKLVD